MIMAIDNNKLLTMKKIVINTGLILGLLTALIMSACKEEIDPIVEQLEFDRAFTPTGLISQISNITTVTLVWNPAKDIDHYVVEIYQGTDFAPASLVHTADVPSGTTTYTYVLPAGDTQFSARVKAISALSGVDDSKWITAEFRSGPENLFTGYESEMTGLGSCTVRWLPGSVATDLLFVSGSTQIPYALTAGEITAGEKMLTGVPTGNYEIRLMNTTFSRGTTHLLLEGDVMLASGDDLLAAINAAASGDVILLAQGGVFIFTGNTTINKSIKIRAVYNENLPTLAAATGASITAPMFLIDAALTPSDSIVFQNVIMTGYINNDPAGGMITGVYDQGTSNACNIGKLKFTGCVLSHFSRQLIRLRGTASQVINDFIVDDCILFDYGTNSTSYGIVSSNNATATINNIKFSNSTIYNFLSYLVLYTNAPSCNSIVIENCTLNQITYTTGSTSRYIIDANNTVFTAGGGITITNSIFGVTAAAHTNGIRASGTKTFTNSYGTSDFDDTFGPDYSIKSSLIAYGGTSTALWTDPLNGIFTFLDGNFAGKATAGAPRWKP
jgi:hypothetical protein